MGCGPLTVHPVDLGCPEYAVPPFSEDEVATAAANYDAGYLAGHTAGHAAGYAQGKAEPAANKRPCRSVVHPTNPMLDGWDCG